ncbi:MAG TPA: nascent polypeptide-associated complex protein [Candidatus Bilamarchaeum sp.]|nr:nascent polypeptide-associated complex protein [Candidatus Bilamarchaeum sp.]
MPGGMDPKKMQAMMRQMGIKSEEIAATKVTIETSEGALIIEEPQVVKITMQGQSSFQISGNVRREEKASADDIKMIMEQTGCSEEAAKDALEKSGGDIAEAILSLGKEE